MTKRRTFVPYPRFKSIPINILPEIRYGSIVRVNPSEMAEWRVSLNDDAFDSLTNDIIEGICDTLYLQKQPDGYEFIPKKCPLSEYLRGLLDDILDEESYFRCNESDANFHRYFAEMTYDSVSGNIFAKFMDDCTGKTRLKISSKVKLIMLVCNASEALVKRYVECGKALELYAIMSHEFTVETDGAAYSELRVRPHYPIVSMEDFHYIEQWLRYGDSEDVQGSSLIDKDISVTDSVFTITFFGHQIDFTGDTLEYRLAKYLFIKASSSHSVLMPNFYESEHREEFWDDTPKEKQTAFKKKVYQATRQLNFRLSRQLNLGGQKSVTTAGGRISLNKRLLGLSEK